MQAIAPLMNAGQGGERTVTAVLGRFGFFSRRAVATAATATDGNLAISAEIGTEGEGWTCALQDLKPDVTASGAAAGHTESFDSYSNSSIATRKFHEKSFENDEIHAIELVRKDSAGNSISFSLEGNLSERRRCLT